MSDDRMFVPSQALNAPIFSENFPRSSRSSKPSSRVAIEPKSTSGSLCTRRRPLDIIVPSVKQAKPAVTAGQLLTRK